MFGSFYEIWTQHSRAGCHSYLVVQIGVFNTTVSGKTASLEKSRQTIESQGETIKGVAEQYESLLGLTQSVLVPYCNGGGELLSEARLGLDPFTRTKTLTIDMMQHIGLDLVEQFAGVLPSNSAGIVLASEGALEIHVQDRKSASTIWMRSRFGS